MSYVDAALGRALDREARRASYPNVTVTTRTEFVMGYLEALAFADWPEDAPQDAKWGTGQRERAEGDAGAFYDAHPDDIATYGARAAGHDFWFTRNGHGVGFWEHDHGTPEACDRLDEAARAAGACGVYTGDDGRIYLY